MHLFLKCFVLLNTRFICTQHEMEEMLTESSISIHFSASYK
ncbi:hypothetical protein BAZSYMA_ACONTIG24004_1 [Bathymodiolus azoricus thioautotrophic gill symbiont]|uniref:Uncharacterized protein n=1 Tax=Bathymodiolus azoricus thioautotrophic gill symbiont TaxID=235205 RepID=A0A1H6M6M3_9GAMM|nr:hypothetical protein BAZSYMA_ACONTIG24004_1 [Bathymodiolus azoricus thioautotrophic gill symbiont]